jgi:hypothetical protein
VPREARAIGPRGHDAPHRARSDDVPNDIDADIRAIVSAKDEVIAGHLAHIGTLKETLAKAETKIASLEARVATAETTADQLRDELQQWRSAGWWRRRRLRRSWRAGQG